MTHYAIGSLVKARSREWVVQSESSDDLLMLRPLSGGEDETTGICPALEPVQPASFDLPDPARLANVKYTVEPKLPADILGMYVYLPA